MRFKYILIVYWAISLISCADEKLLPTEANSNDKEMSLIELFTNASEYQVPSVRSGSADENTLGATPWVIVFNGTTDNSVFFELTQAFVIGNKSYVRLTETTNPTRLLIIANTPATFFDGTSEKAFNSTNLTAYLTEHPVFADAVNNLLSPGLSRPMQTTVPYADTTPPLPAIPMSGIYNLAAINAETTIGTSTNKVQLNRVVAKVIVENTSPDFTLLSAGVTGASANGRLYQAGSSLMDNTGNTTDYLSSATGDGTAGIAPAVSNSTAANPIYLYESQAEQRTSVIIRGSYQSGTYYYRLAFNENIAEALTDVLRNKQYTFNITYVDAPGYATMEEAKMNPAANIRYRITVTDQTSTQIADNGDYFVGVSNSEFRLYNSNMVNNALAFTITTNATESFGTNSISYVPTSGDNLTITPSQVVLSPSRTAITSTQVFVNFPPFSTSASGSVVIRIGDVSHVITILREQSLEVVDSQMLFNPFVSASVDSQTGTVGWVSLTSTPAISGTSKLTLSQAGDIYLQWNENPAGGNNRTAQITFSRPGNQGNVVVSVLQKAP